MDTCTIGEAEKLFHTVETTWAKSLNQQRTGLMQGAEQNNIWPQVGVRR